MRPADEHSYGYGGEQFFLGMTFNPTEAHLWYKELPMFMLWALKKGVLFFPKEAAEDDEFKQYDLTSKIYIFMKRLHQSYDTIMLMDSDERDRLFEMEMKLLKEEIKEQKEAKEKK